MNRTFKPIRFPGDHSAHKCIIEWWYFNGHLRDKRGNTYAFMDCLFKADNKRVKIPFLRTLPVKTIYFSHRFLSDIKRNKFQDEINPLEIVSHDTFSRPRLYVNYTHPTIEGYINYELKEETPFNFHLKSSLYDLKFTSIKKPLLEAGRGHVILGDKSTYYYSLTNLKTEGYITANDQTVAVTGKSWFDHQWADVVYSRDRWNWFSLQLDNNLEIVCFEYDAKISKYYLATLSYPDGRQISTSKINLVPRGDEWRSTKTGARYPLSWKITIPAEDIYLNVTPLLRKQEMIFGEINYWEGPLKVQGMAKGRRVQGQGFMELVGYPMEEPKLAFYTKELKSQLNKIISRLKNIIKRKRR